MNNILTNESGHIYNGYYKCDKNIEHELSVDTPTISNTVTVTTEYQPKSHWNEDGEWAYYDLTTSIIHLDRKSVENLVKQLQCWLDKQI